jgi:hypothetical protein
MACLRQVLTREEAEAMRLALLIALAACAARPQAAEPPVAPTPWCFRLVFAFNGKPESAVACGESLALCQNAQRRAVKFGGLMGAREVGRCQSR